MNEISRPTNRRIDVNFIEMEDSPHVYIRNLGPRQTKTPAHLLIPYTSRQTGQQKTIEVPMTSIPFDLADHCPKEELMRNPELRGLWNSRLLEFVPTKQALEELDTDDARDEQERLFHMSQVRRRANEGDDDITRDQPPREQQDAMNRLRAEGLPQAQPGQIDQETAGISGSVVACMTDADMSNAHRLGLLRNMNESGILTDKDKRYVRSKTEDAKIRQLVG